MLEQQSKGSKWGAIAGIVITFAFFLPWLRACNVESSGYDLAAKGYNLEAIWFVLLGGLVAIALFFIIKTDQVQKIQIAAIARLIASIIGIATLLNIYKQVQSQAEQGIFGLQIEILFGGWFTALGYAGLVVSALVDFFESRPIQVYTTPVQSPYQPPYSPPPGSPVPPPQPVPPRTIPKPPPDNEVKPWSGPFEDI